VRFFAFFWKPVSLFGRLASVASVVISHYLGPHRLGYFRLDLLAVGEVSLLYGRVCYDTLN
jgi:hypothetical protein